MATTWVVAAPSRVEAQAWLSDRQRAEGPGIRVGDFELHPGLGVEAGYNSNLFYSSGNSMVPIVGTGLIRATPHLFFSTRGAQRRQEGESGGAGAGGAASTPAITFRGGLTGSFYHFFARQKRDNMAAGANLELGILHGHPFSIDITENFTRYVRPFTPNTRRNVNYARNNNNAGIRLNFATSGDVLKVSAGYNFGLRSFESRQFSWADNFRHTISLEEQFRFLPQTAIVHETNVRIVDYFNYSSASAPTLANNGILVSSRVGLNGALTDSFSVLGLVGYGAGFFQSRVATYQQEYESLVAQVEGRWQISTNTRLVFGYDRGFQPSYIGNWYRQDRVYGRFQILLGGSFLLGLNAWLGYYQFGKIVAADGMTPIGSNLNRSDIRVNGELFGEYRFTNWLAINATFQYYGDFTGFAYLPATTGTGLTLPTKFNQIQVYGGVRVYY